MKDTPRVDFTDGVILASYSCIEEDNFDRRLGLLIRVEEHRTRHQNGMDKRITLIGFIIFLVCSRRHLRTKTNVFVVSLGVADFCVGMNVVPSLFFLELIEQSHSKGLDKGLKLVRWLFQDASAMNMCILVLDRYIAVVKPLKYLTFMTSTRVIQLISFSWVVTIGIFLVESSLLFTSKGKLVLIWLIIALFFFLPNVMIGFCFASMFRVVYMQNRTAYVLGRKLCFYRRREKSALIMMAIVTVLFPIYCGSYIRCVFINIWNDQCSAFNYSVPMLLSNSAVNSLAYAFFKRDIKTRLKHFSVL